MAGERKKTSGLPIFITEEHNNVVPYIHRAIRSRKLPFSDVPMVHLDSHPDLLIPQNLRTETVFAPQDLYESVSIENWLLPQVFAKHINPVVWVKPPWASQIQASSQQFMIGKCVNTGLMRVSCRENYFLTDGLYRNKACLTDGTQVHLLVLELKPQNWEELDVGYFQSQKNSTPDSESSQLSDYSQWTDLLQDMLKDKAYILDIDLDFFSTQNPFKDMLSPPTEEAVRRLYTCPPLAQLSDEELSVAMTKREAQLALLEEIWTKAEIVYMQDKDQSSNVVTFPMEDKPFSELLGMEKHKLAHYDEKQQCDIREILSHVIQSSGQVSFTQVHDFGCTLDDTELPHHVSTDQQVEALLSTFSQVLEHLPRPTIVTIARSSNDEYCPPSSVDLYERKVLQLMEKLYGKLDITKDVS